MKATRLLALTAGGFCCLGCTFRSVQLEYQPPGIEAGELKRLRVGVEAAAGVPTEVARRFASDLRQTGVFKEVVEDRGSRSLDLVAEVEAAGGVARCGTPDVLSRVTLGLWHGSTSYFHNYAVVFRGESEGRDLTFDSEYLGTMGSGLLSLPRRASRRWSRWPSGGTPPVVIDALRGDLTRAAPDLLRLAGDQTERASPVPAHESLHGPSSRSPSRR